MRCVPSSFAAASFFLFFLVGGRPVRIKTRTQRVTTPVTARDGPSLLLHAHNRQSISSIHLCALRLRGGGVAGFWRASASNQKGAELRDNPISPGLRV